MSAGNVPSWLRPLVDNVDRLPKAYLHRLPVDVRTMMTAASAAADVTGSGRDAAVLVLFSGPPSAQPGAIPESADLLVTVRAST
ncbi:MAG TPA: coenzyme A pyrophosphatase, partial [Mycobacterium sp.]|nr:coenzyme A pyrophosphatase [Mycobacterium sp.]